MDHNNPQISSMRLSTAKSLTFQTFSAEEIRNLSVVKVITPLSFNSLNHPLPGGLYDPAMGPVSFGALCATCGLTEIKCSGHFGHIELPLPVLNPIYHKPVQVILKNSCLSCHNVLIPFTVKCVLIGQLSLLHYGLIVEAQEMFNAFADYLDEKNTNWKVQDRSLRDVGAAKINEYVESRVQAKNTSIKQWRGEADLRNSYIKTALSYSYKGKSCPYCSSPLQKLAFLQNNILVPTKLEVASKFNSGKGRKKADVSSSNYSFLMPSECNDHLSKIFLEDGPLITALLPVLIESKCENRIDSLFMEVVPVPPINARPISFLNGSMNEHPQNLNFKEILNDCMILRSVIHLMNNKNQDDLNESVISKERLELVQKLKGTTYSDKLQFAWTDLQKHVDALLDVESQRTRNVAVGLKQIIERKAGIIRMNMMGKRVNFAARTVITPDPNLNIDEIGIPEVFARKLTYPVPVTYYNVNELRKVVINGPFIHPGANLVENEDGSFTKLDGQDLSQREGIAKKLLTPSDKKGIKIVHRHLVDGDILLLNRQPTLHKPSIMAHKARILKGEKTFRMHYANCKSYNADFDGDEMNAHFPQNEVARSEGYNLVSSSRQYLVPKDGTPLSGLIQDHVVSGVRLSIRGRFFTREDYMQLCFQGLTPFTGNIKHLPPCMIKPVRLWSGKQVISTIILNIIPRGYKPINLTSRAKISSSAWPASKDPVKAGSTPFRDSFEMTEAEVVIREGELLCGVLDKMHFGATPYSLVHCIHELYGSEVSSRLLSSFSKLFTAFLQTEGFTLGVEDILVVKKADAERRKIVEAVRQIGEDVASKALDSSSVKNLREALGEAHRKDPTFRALLDHEYKKSLDNFTNSINKTCLPSGLFKRFPANDLQLMVQSGAKGSTVNTMQISCLLGQIELEGKRPPLMISGRSLPSFPPYDPSPRAGGFIDGRFMTGIRPQEFFFHCMAGREGLIDTAVKTSRSGYLQRCLVKHLEGLSVHYDLTVRDSDGSIVQFLYGEDGMEVTKCQFLTIDQLPFLVDNVQALLLPEVANSLKDGSNLKGVKKHKRSLKKWSKAHKEPPIRKPSPFCLFSQQAEFKKPSSSNKDIAKQLCEKWIEMEDEEKKPYKKLCQPSPDPVVSKLQPDRHFGSVTEKLDEMVNSYLKNYGSQVDAQTLEDVVHLKALSSLANPGEPVGLLAAQSIGEPSTQMTLNTFHFAGRGEMNVTLGIPRLREILMVASKNIKTPSMEIPFRRDVHKVDKKADRLRRKLTRVTMFDVLEFVEVTENLQLKPLRRQMYTLKFNFLPKEAYADNCIVTPQKILKHFENRFIKELLFNIKRKSNKKSLIDTDGNKEGGDDGFDVGDVDDPEERGSKKRRTGGPGGGAGDDVEDSEEENDDDDATTQRRRERQNEEYQYSDLEDEDEDVRQEIEGMKTKTKKEDGESDEEKDVTNKETVSVKEEGDRKCHVTSLDNVVSYSFDTVNQQWCQVTLSYPTQDGRVDFSTKLKVLAAQSVIHEVRGLRKAFLPTTTNGEKILKTDGKNLMEMYDYVDLLDINRLYTNDIHAVAETYGIEAAAKVIVKEIQEVFKVYGITVDPRHLTLVADYMTFDGVYRPLNRVGMEGGASPLQQMSFEASLGFLKSSVLRSKIDDILSPSARLMLGRPVSSGTSCFNLLYSLGNGNIF
uniref:DNA-directed RNA polymerase subunit n=2 Tax=Lygus hesperus TaxID=30085 RepID=A0A0A9YLI0_LYGHE